MSNLNDYMNMKNAENHNLENLLLQEHIKRNPFELKFHLDGQTDTLDFYGGRTSTKPSSEHSKIKNYFFILKVGNFSF